MEDELELIKNLYDMARGSTFEAQDHLIDETALGCFQEKECEKFVNHYDELIHQLNKLLKSIS
ncbi:four helix bundle protein [Membranicola marinus]|uniref:Four helix bundle protein n=1 Tax=Membranihabitans marinus TaxID=1227546 RepID=A0A953L923_9BACT|nr:four helix bundle protein [Membranihabitans marinus]MBY5958365.1 four helix bundle protein [Membranihabitans marinus]